MNKEMTIGALKAEFSNVINGVMNGETYIVLKGRNKKKVAMLVPYQKNKEMKKPEKKRKLGKMKGLIVVKKDFDILPGDVMKYFGAE